MNGNRSKRLVGARILGLALLAASLGGPTRAGEINSYSGLPVFTEPYRMGWQLAVEEITRRAGSTATRCSSSRATTPASPPRRSRRPTNWFRRTAWRCSRAVSSPTSGWRCRTSPRRKKNVCIAGELLTDALVWWKGNRYTFRLRASNYVQAANFADAAAKLPAERWATIAPNFEYGQSAIAAFKKLLSAKRPDVGWVGEQ